MLGKHPIFFIALSFLIGILNFHFKFFSFLLLVPALLLSLQKISQREILLLLTFFVMGWGYSYTYNIFLDNGRSKTIGIVSRKPITMQGKIVKRISPTGYFMEADSLILLDKTFSTHLRVYIRSFKNLKIGDYVQVSGKLMATSDLQGSFGYYLYSQNIYGALLKVQKLKVLKFKGSFLEKLRATLENRVQSFPINRFSKGLLLALLTGNKGKLFSSDKELFAQSGTSHVLAVSGLHIGILVSFVMLLLRIGYYISLRREHIYGFAIVVIWGFALFTGGSASVLRAALMTTVYLIAKIFARRISVFNVIGITLYLLLLARPNFVLDIGFQMSFAAVLGIVVLFPLLKKCFNFNSKYLITKYLYESTLVSLSAQLGVLPLTLYWFGSFPVYFLLSNIFVVPLIFLIFYTGLFYVFLGTSFLQTSYEFLVKILVKYLQLIIQLPNSVITISPHNVWLFIFSSSFVFLLGIGIYYFNKHFRQQRKIYWELL